MRVDVSDASWAQGAVDSQNWQPAKKGGTIVFFYDREVQNNAKSLAEGRPIFDLVCYIKKLIPGDSRLEVDRKASQQDKLAFQAEYDQYLKKQQVPLTGTPLEAWPPLDRKMVAELKAMNIFSVDQLASLPDAYGAKIMGFQGWKQKAQNFLAAAQDSSLMERQNAELVKRDAQLAEQAGQIVKMQEQIAVLMANQKQKPGRKPKPKPYGSDSS